MKSRLILLVLFLAALLHSAPARAEGVDGDLYVLGVAIDQVGGAGGWARVGPAGAWKGTLAGAVLDGHLFTVDDSGKLWETDQQTGAWKQIGKADFAATAFMFAGGKIGETQLYTIEKDGNLYRVNPKSGDWVKVGKESAWKQTLAGAVLNGELYSVENNGGLWRTNLDTGAWAQVGKRDFANVQHLFAAENLLYSIEKDGCLYRINPRDGSWVRVGPAGAWKTTLAGTIIRDQLYTVEQAGGLWFTDLRTGSWKSIGKADFAATQFMFPAGGDLSTIEASGSLYRVAVKAGPTIDCFNWCTEEVEKLFREQGNAFYHKLITKHILGEKATHQEVMGGLAWLKQNATPKDMVVMYIGAHGSTHPAIGWGISTADDKTLWGHQVKAELAKLPCPVLLMIETCTSGGFAQPHPKDAPVPDNVMVLCACQENQVTNNQLDLAVAEALYGRGDFNKDGTVNVDELCRYVESRYKEWWPNPAAAGAQSPVIVRSKKLPATQPLTRTSASLSAVAFRNGFWSALVEKQEGDNFQVHLMGWSCHPGEPYFVTNAATRDTLCTGADGPPLLVEQKGNWWAAKLIKQEGSNYTIRYLEKNQEETVPRERVKFPFVGE